MPSKFVWVTVERVSCQDILLEIPEGVEIQRHPARYPAGTVFPPGFEALNAYRNIILPEAWVQVALDASSKRDDWIADDQADWDVRSAREVSLESVAGVGSVPVPAPARGVSGGG